MKSRSAVPELRRPLRAALVSGTAAAVLSTLALAICGKLEEDSAAGPLNGPSQWLWGRHAASTRRASWRHTASGYAIHHAMSILWAGLHGAAFSTTIGRRGKGAARHLAEAALTAGIAYFVDYNLTPRRLRPGFKMHLGPISLFAVYAAFAAGLGGARIVRRHRRR